MAWKRKKWFDDVIESELLKCIDILQINRMPTSTELKSIGRNDLHMAIQKSKKYSGWAERLNLKRKMSDTLFGQTGEELAAEHLEKSGFNVRRMPTKHPYDLLVNDVVKVDVKTAKPFFVRGSRVHTFALNKQNPTCDIYIARALDESGSVERVLVIPSHMLRIRTLCIGKESKYNKYKDRWDLIKEYSNFYKEIV
ncbi:hypothetical protein [Paenibacillus sp. IITD108]|uniref:hypothetical protein n=1 Tax=Paenibacillus sp. IITD108 TaxID=3116649 RepID=UPI002F42F790